MKTNDRLIRKTFLGVLAINLVSMVSGIASIMIDAVITGQFLGSDAVAAMGLIQPVTMLCNVIGTLFGPGLGIVCTRYMGMAKPDRVNQVFSLIMTVLAGTAFLIAGGLYLLAPSIAQVLGAKTNDPTIVAMIVEYLRGFSLGMPFMGLTMALSGLMVLDNDRMRGMVTMIVVLISDVVFDLLNVLVFYGGMRGMALATSFSHITGFLVVCTHFLKKDRILHFRLRSLHAGDIVEVVLCGIPNSIASSSAAIRMLAFNAILMMIATKTEISALSVANSAFSVIVGVSIASTASTSMICSLFLGEEDRNAIVSAFRFAAKIVVCGITAIMLLYMIGSVQVAGLFLRSDNAAELSLAARFIFVMALQFLLMGISFPLCGAYQGIRRMIFNYLLVGLREGILPITCALIGGLAFGLNGFLYGIAAAGLLELICCFLIPVLVNKRLSFRAADLLLIPETLGAAPEDMLEASVQDMDGVMDTAQRVMQFCRDKGADTRTAFMASLFIEETVGNTVRHGFPEGKKGNIDLRVIYSREKHLIRIRDDGKPFDPVEWYARNHPEDPSSGVGIRIVTELARDVRYIPAMGLNHLVIELP